MTYIVNHYCKFEFCSCGCLFVVLLLVIGYYLYFRSCWASYVPIPHRVRWCVLFTYVSTTTAMTMTIAATTLTTYPLRSSISDTITKTTATAVVAWQDASMSSSPLSQSVPMQNRVVRTSVVYEAEDTTQSHTRVAEATLCSCWMSTWHLKVWFGNKRWPRKKDGHKSTVSEKKSGFEHLKFNDSYRMSALEKSILPRY